MGKIILEEAIERRKEWVSKIANLSGIFAENSLQIESQLSSEIEYLGTQTILDHLRLCGNIPESYGHDTSEEKQYSNNTDRLLSLAYKQMGLKSIVLTERADVADVEAFAREYSFVADAKAFRLSRTAKNPKDFKVQAMDRWKHGKPYAMVVCPIYQLSSKSSQIYIQAITRNVCVFTYSHLSLLVRYSEEVSKRKAEDLLLQIFNIIPTMNPSKSANDYWMTINRTMLNHSKSISKIWQDEKIAALESIEIAKKEALIFLASQREKFVRMSREEAINALIKASKIDNKVRIVNKISDNGLLGLK